VVNFEEDYTGDIFLIDSTYNIDFNQKDPVKVSYLELKFSSDGGDSWEVFYSSEPEVDFDTYGWTIPDTPSEECVLNIYAEDQTGNTSSETSGTFSISYEAVAEEATKPKRIVMDIYPNPFNSAVKIEVSSQLEVGNITITNIEGKVIDQFITELGEGEIIWQPSNIPTGIYNCRYSSENGFVASRKLLYIK
jgi:hypothetical protein